MTRYFDDYGRRLPQEKPKLKTFYRPQTFKLGWEAIVSVIVLLVLPFIGAMLGVWYAMNNNW